MLLEGLMHTLPRAGAAGRGPPNPTPLRGSLCSQWSIGFCDGFSNV